MTEAKTVPCKWCTTPTPMLGTRECDHCHELYRRLEGTRSKVIMHMLHHLYTHNIFKKRS
jgi:hypothetical protein